MKWFYWIASLALHFFVFYLASFALSEPAEFGMEHAPSSVEVNLIAAAPADKASPESLPDTMPEQPDLSTISDMESWSKPEPVQPKPQTETPQPRINPTPNQLFHGDGSSPTAGQDSTTLKSSQGSNAEAKPDYFRNPAPAYPESSRRAGHEGRVLLSVEVNASGRVTNLQIKSGSGYPALDQAALKTVRRWIFKPAKAGGVALSSRVDVPIRFELD
jgi:periplasmic protein TonB